MADEKEVKEVENKADADAGEKLDKVLAHLDSVMTACDSLSKRMDSYDEEKKAKADAEEAEMADKAKKDAEEAEEKAKADEGKDLIDDKPVELAADKAKKDAEEAEAAEKAKADSDDIKKMIADVAARLPRVMSDAEHAEMATVQERADSVFHAFGQRAPRPLEGETIERYRRRLATKLKTHSPDWKDVDLSAMVDNKAFSAIENRVYADALNAANHPTDLEAGTMRQITKTDPVTGQRMHSFVGRSTFITEMKREPRRVIGIGQPRH